jgi:NADPH:quinone reductase-like Zn-dependent oxidoreductase
MRAAVVSAFGGPGVLRIEERAAPEPGPGEVRVRMRAAAMNPIDCKLREGRFRRVFRVAPPFVGGFDLAGEVEALGPGVSGLAAGDRVFGALGTPGAHADRVCAPAEALLPLPRGLSFEEAAALPGAGLSALIALRDLARVEAGDRVLLNGASGGVGTMAIQLAKTMGARVTAVASAANQDLLRELGVDEAVDYATEDVTRRRGAFDAFFDIAPASTFGRARRALRPGGVYVTTLPGPSAIFWRAATALPFFGGRRCRMLVLIPRRDDLALLRRDAEERRLRPVLSEVLPLERIRDAHERMQSGHTRGKIVLVP